MKSNQKSKFRPVINETPQSSDAIRGRGASWSPANRFEKLHVDVTDTDVVDPVAAMEERPRQATQYFRDSTKTIIAHNNSPDVGFETSINPYRGCEHGCIYCYARPTHEYLGFSAGLDFESRIMVKEDAPRVARSGIVVSEVEAADAGDERRDRFVISRSSASLEITRGCLRSAGEISQSGWRSSPKIVWSRAISTSVRRAGAHHAVAVYISVTSFDPDLQRILEPRTSTPQARLDAVAQLRAAGIPVGVMVAPIIPGLTDHEIPAILEACGEGRRAICRLRLAAFAVGRRAALRALAGRTFP